MLTTANFKGRTMTSKQVPATAKRKPPSKAKEPKVNKSRHLEIVEQAGVSIDRVKAQLALSGTMPNASTALDYSLGLFPELSLNECAKQMNSDIQAVNGGDLDKLEGMLTAQAAALNAMFNNFAKRAIHADIMPKLEAYFRMALKAQAQCRSTVEAIAEIKYPKSATFIKQANIAGQQQVNNGQAGFSHQYAHRRARENHHTNERTINGVTACDTGRKRNDSGKPP